MGDCSYDNESDKGMDSCRIERSVIILSAVSRDARAVMLINNMLWGSVKS